MTVLAPAGHGPDPDDLAALLDELTDDELATLLDGASPEELDALEASLPIPETRLDDARADTADPIAWAKEWVPALIPLDAGPHHEEIAGALTADGPSGVRFVEGAPRGSGKSTVALTILPLIAAVRASHRMIVVVRSREPDAVSAVGGIRAILEGRPDLIDAYPWLRPTNRAEEELHLAGGIVIIARGSGSAIRGLSRVTGGRVLRPELVIADDVETEESARSKLQTDRLEEWILSVIGQLGGPPGEQITGALDVVVIGTTLEPDALVSRMLDGSGAFAGWHRARFPAEGIVARVDGKPRGGDGAALIPGTGGRLAVVDTRGEPTAIPVPDDADEGDRVALWADGMPLDYLDELTRADPGNPLFVGTRIYAREFLLRPVTRGDTLFDRDRTVWVEGLTGRVTEAEIRVERVGEGVDPAATEKESSDWTAIVVTALVRRGDVLDGDPAPDAPAVAVLYAARRRVSLNGAMEWVEEVAALFDHLGIRVAFESQGGFAWAAGELRRRGAVSVRAVSVKGDKLQRATPLSVWHESRRVLVDADLQGTAWDDEFHAFTGTGRDVTDDLVDATVLAGAYSTNAWRRR